MSFSSVVESHLRSRPGWCKRSEHRVGVPYAETVRVPCRDEFMLAAGSVREVRRDTGFGEPVMASPSLEPLPRQLFGNPLRRLPIVEVQIQLHVHELIAGVPVPDEAGLLCIANHVENGSHAVKAILT